MSSNKYTLDRFEGEFAVFLKRPAETEQLLIPRLMIDIEVAVGDIVEIEELEKGYRFTKLEQEKEDAQQRLNDLLSRLNRKNL